jgi:hypothetical protein
MGNVDQTAIINATTSTNQVESNAQQSLPQLDGSSSLEYVSNEQDRTATAENLFNRLRQQLARREVCPALFSQIDGSVDDQVSMSCTSSTRFVVLTIFIVCLVVFSHYRTRRQVSDRQRILFIVDRMLHVHFLHCLQMSNVVRVQVQHKHRRRTITRLTMLTVYSKQQVRCTINFSSRDRPIE